MSIYTDRQNPGSGENAVFDAETMSQSEQEVLSERSPLDVGIEMAQAVLGQLLRLSIRRPGSVLGQIFQ
ncbi:MAG: hypothetical protein U5K77_03790 [Candidatus Saccharibacteria bacterium]|nr:hypothetical protein [Candidatus Saccharibacteria bacterium]